MKRAGRLVRMRDISKRFGSVTALHEVNYEAFPKAINAIIGENGAGKTTLVRILYGLTRPDAGLVSLDNNVLTSGYKPGRAISEGLGMLPQHFNLIPSFPVLDHLILGNEPQRRGTIEYSSIREHASQIINHLGVELDIDAKVSNLSVSQCQLVELVRMMLQGSRVLIFDEPTASLAPQEIDRFYAILKDLAANDATIILITHRIREVIEHCHRVTVLRKGRITGHYDSSEVTERKLICSIVDATKVPVRQRPEPVKTDVPPLLSLKDVKCIDDENRPVLRNVSLEVRAGEVYGIAGVAGSGQRELLETVAGVRKATGGIVALEGRDVSDNDVHERRKQGLVYVPEDRLCDGLISSFSLLDNSLLGDHREKRFRTLIGYDTYRLEQDVRKKINNYRITASGPHELLGNLSGGNQQKVMLARELERSPRLVIAHSPMRGLDVSSSTLMYRILLRLAAEGSAVLLFSPEIEDLLATCHRIGVLYAGELIEAGPSEYLDITTVGLMMTRGVLVAETGEAS